MGINQRWHDGLAAQIMANCTVRDINAGGGTNGQYYAATDQNSSALNNSTVTDNDARVIEYVFNGVIAEII